MAKQTTKKIATKLGRPPKAEGGMDVQVSIKLPASLRDAASEKSARTGVAVAFIVRKCLEEWVRE
jgi:predicted DNA-binding protein